MKIALDIDDVLASSGPFLDFLNRRFGKNFTFEDISYKLSETYGISVEELKEAFLDFYNSGGFLKVDLIPGALGGVNELSKKHSLIAITARPLYMKDHTIQWINENFPEIFEEIHFSEHPVLFKGEGTALSKSKICIDSGADVLIDDHLLHLTDCMKNGVRALLFDLDGRYGWNKENVANVERVSSWKEIVDRLN